MEIGTIEKIFNFLEEKENKQIPKKILDSIEVLKLIEELENYPDGTQYRHEGDLYLDNSGITKLPNNLYVSGHLNLSKCTELTKLPDKLHVVGNLNLWYCQQLTELPDNLYVGNTLNITKTNIEEIPNNLYVDKFLFLWNTPLAKKYTDDEIRRNVNLNGGKIRGKIYR